MPQALQYIGQGAFLVDVPARDLTADEADQYGPEALLASGLYAPQPAVPAAAATTPATPADEGNT